MAYQPTISVLMTSYNHASYVEAQVESILGQDYGNWRLTVSDNGSTDGSLAILKRYEGEHPDRVKVVAGPGGDGIKNYMELVANADPVAEYYALCGSDDVWLPSHLSRAMEVMSPYGQGEPVLYTARMAMIDGGGRQLGLTPIRNRVAPSFANALLQCLGFTPTFVLNRPARELVALGRGYVTRTEDWWSYVVVVGAGGRVIYDPEPHVLYRIHATNISGSDKGLRAKLKRLNALLGGDFHRWQAGNIEALAAHLDRLTPANREILAVMESLHRGEGSALERLRKVRYGGFRRQSPLESFFLYAMALMKWF